MDLLAAEPPSPRAALEIEREKAQAAPAYRELGLPLLRPSRAMSDATLKTIVGLHRELDRRARMAISTPEEARRANTQHRTTMRERNNHLPEIELIAEQATKAVRHSSGALTHRTVAEMAKRVGLTIVHTDDLPHSARAVVDLEHGRIYIPPASIPGGHGLRSLALQAMANTVLEHEAVAESAAVGVPDEVRGHTIKSYVVLKEGIKGTDEIAKEIQDLVRRRLSTHAYPREVEFVAELPKTPSGKIQRFLLRSLSAA